jgi:hypothetical protein
VETRYKLVMLNLVTGEERPSTAMRNTGYMSSKEADAKVKDSKKKAAKSKTNWVYKKVPI